MREREERLHRISTAFDGEAPMPDDLDAEDEAFLAAAARLRSTLRVEEAEVPPDVTRAVLARVADPVRPPRTARPTVLVAAAVFVVAALLTALAVRPGGPAGPSVAAADVGDRVLAAQHDVVALDAEVTLLETGAHPDLPERTYEGTLRYRAPEQLWLRFEDRTLRSAGWPANDIDLVVDDGIAWSTGIHGCPVADQPACLDEPETRLVRGLAPFAEDWVAPLDLVVPADAFLPQAQTTSTEAGGAVVVDTTVARLRQLIDGLQTAGALRAVHVTDLVRLELDPDSFTIRRLAVLAGDTAARSLWAAENGYSDAPGTTVLELTVTPGSLPDAVVPAPPDDAEVTDAGFRDTPDLPGPVPRSLPEGFSAHRAGVHDGPGARIVVRSWSNGRAWIRIESTSEWSGEVLFGNLGPLVRAVPVGGGTGFTDPEGSTLALRTGTVDLAITGSVPLETLVDVAASLPLTGQQLPDGWPQGELLTTLPSGALRPPGPVTARYEGSDLVVAVPGPGATSAVLTQRPGESLGLPVKGDLVEAEVRGTTGRYAPRLGTLTWVEGGWIRELRSDGLDLAALTQVAAELERA
jgi:hypothetical protein